VHLRFEILDADVATILGMPFLETCNPIINWKRKTIAIKHKNRVINIPTLSNAKVLTPNQTVAPTNNIECNN
jgi:hypothetical protein